MRALYRNRVINMIFTCVLLFVFFGALAVGGTVSGALFGKGMAFLLAEIAVILFATALDLREMIVLSRLYRRLSSGTPPESADWRAHAARNRAVFLTGVFLLLAFIVLFFTGIAHKRSGVTELPGSAVPDLPYPYPVTAALFPDGETAYDEAFYARSFVRQTKDLFAPQVIETEEYVTVGRDGETVFSGFVDVCFCETSFSFLADRVAAEWLTEAGHESHYSGTEESVCPNGVRVLRYTALFPTLLFTYDRYAVKVTFCAFGDTAFPEEAAVEAFAAVIGG